MVGRSVGRIRIVKRVPFLIAHLFPIMQGREFSNPPGINISNVTKSSDGVECGVGQVRCGAARLTMRCGTERHGINAAMLCVPVSVLSRMQDERQMQVEMPCWLLLFQKANQEGRERGGLTGQTERGPCKSGRVILTNVLFGLFSYFLYCWERRKKINKKEEKRRSLRGRETCYVCLRLMLPLVFFFFFFGFMCL